MSAPVHRQITGASSAADAGAPLLRTSAVVTVDASGGPVAELHLHGDLGPSTAASLRNEVERLLEDGVLVLTVDLAGLRLCTSHGLDILQEADERLRRAGGGVHLINASGAVQHVLEVVEAGDPTFSPTVQR